MGHVTFILLSNNTLVDISIDISHHAKPLKTLVRFPLNGLSLLHIITWTHTQPKKARTMAHPSRIMFSCVPLSMRKRSTYNIPASAYGTMPKRVGNELKL
jgi:hypothetical protein